MKLLTGFGHALQYGAAVLTSRPALQASDAVLRQLRANDTLRAWACAEELSPGYMQVHGIFKTIRRFLDRASH